MKKAKLILPIIFPVLIIMGTLAVSGHAEKPLSPPVQSKPEPKQKHTKALSVAGGRIYHYRPKTDIGIGTASRNIEVTETKDGYLKMKQATEDAKLAMIMSPSGKMTYVPDALGSEGIRVLVDKEVGFTTLAGLKFRQDCVINVWKDGTIEVDRVGVTATDDANAHYVSQEAKIKNTPSIVMVQELGKHSRSQTDLETALVRAEILSMQGSSEEAYAAFEEVLNLAVDKETKARAIVGMAHILDIDGRSKEAQELYLKASGVTTNPDTKAMILIGQTGPLLQQRRLAEARTKVEEALGLATEPQTKAAAMMTASGLDIFEGDVERGRKRFIAAGEIVESAIRGSEDNEKKANFKLVLAIIFMAQSRWNDVETTIEEAFDLTENEENKCTILQFQGGIFSSRKQTEKARHTFEQALKLAPTPDHLAKCFTGLGEVAEYEGKPSEALANYDKALAKATSKETRSLALFKKGTVLMEQGSSQEAILSFEEVIRLTKSVHRKARSLANIGSALAGQGKLTEARRKLEEALSFPLRPSVKKQIENLLQKVKRATSK